MRHDDKEDRKKDKFLDIAVMVTFGALGVLAGVAFILATQ